MKKMEEKIFLFYLISWLFLMIYVHGASGLCDAGRFGPGCRYVCHCGDGSESCNEVTGACPTAQGCARGYHGRNCQRENVALDKPASQSDTSSIYYASLAVDGNPSSNFAKLSCTRTPGGVSISEKGYSWWRVDLGQEYDIHYLSVYNRKDQSRRLQGMSININGILCYKDTDSIPPEVINVACTRTLRSQYVVISTGHSQNILTLCEVQIFVCTDYWFGENCDKTCNCKDVTEVCHKVNGACESGCPDGYRNDNCKTVCTDYWFGENCGELCNCKDETEICDKLTGACTSGCADGYRDDNCTTACSDGQYGFECSESCDNCATSSTAERKCDHVTGQCYAGCVPGYKGLFCNETCDFGRYGNGCNSTCNELCQPVANGSSICDHMTGMCTDGCQDGYIASQELICSPACAGFMFGQHCNQSCNCKNKTEVCHKATGGCSSGCPPGFNGDNCQLECDDHWFGENCNQSCNCRNETEVCNKVNGACLSGCAAGFQGDDCKTACTDYNFGNDCNQTCNCRNESEVCNKTTGACSSGCATGFLGDNCSRECDDHSFGEDCVQRCNCRNESEVCDKATGACTSGCVAEFQGDDCKTACTGYWFGDDCSQTCNCRDETEMCNKTTGACTSGCAAGFQGDDCKTECSDYWFGEECVQRCNCRSESEMCNKTTGACSSGCAAGFQGDDCKTACSDNWFGDDCVRTCNCRSETDVCNKSTGVCSSGCAAGFQDDDCKTACSNAQYGFECSQSCDNCATPSTGGRKCDQVNGQCNAGCIAGYKDIFCNHTCDSGSYGINCTSICNEICKPVTNGLAICHHVTGTCTSGCKDGYMVAQDSICLPECADYKFGENCSQTCNCISENDVCDKITGVCSSGCAAGFHGNGCKTVCSNGQYGFQCSESCDNCATPSTSERKCHHVTGQCNAGCKPGYKEILCNLKCDFGRYGIDCSSSCNERCQSVDDGLPICHHVTGRCTSGCQDGYTVSQDSICALAMPASTNPSETGASAGLIAGIAIGCVVAITLIATLIVLTLRRRRNSQKTDHNSTNRTVSIIDRSTSTTVSQSSSEEKGPAQLDIVISDEPNVDEAHSYLDVAGDLYCNELSLPTVSVREGIALDDLWDYVAKQMRSGGLKAEYEKLPASLLYAVSAALKPENKGKSRYLNIYAYDHTRVILDMPPGASHTDYINANYIPGYKDPQKYIAAQGPTAIIMDDFWRMVWQENCSKIVALTRLVEGGRIKCDQYWPDSGSKEYGDIGVEMIQVEEFPDFAIRTLIIGHTKSPDKRLLKQFHFLSWPDHGVPDYATALINFKDKVATTSSSTTGPIVVHCSAGIGRSGTFIGLDFLIEQAKAEGRVDIFGCINNMRNYRVNMIQTGEQYEFLYDALLEALSLSPISLASSEFLAKYAKSNKVNNLSGKTYLQEQFELMNLLSPSGKPGDCMCAESEGNKGKHRDAKIMAADNHRVYLPKSNTDTGDYINAVYLPTYKESKPFIITQMPLADTVIDFWRMVYDNKCRTIVMLNDDNIEADACYWSRDGTPLTIGPFTITSELDRVSDKYDVMSLELRHADKVDEVLKIHQYQCKFWPSSEKIPPDATSFLAVLNGVERWQQKNENSTIVVHCMNGADRNGVYCIISAVIDRLKMEQQVNISQTVKRFRKCRPQIISSLEQYQFCHDVVVAYLESFEIYSNFV